MPDVAQYVFVVDGLPFLAHSDHCRLRRHIRREGYAPLTVLAVRGTAGLLLGDRNADITRRQENPMNMKPAGCALLFLAMVFPAFGQSFKPDPIKPEPIKADPIKPESPKSAPIKADPVKPEITKPTPIRPEPIKPEPIKPDPIKADPIKP